MHPYRNWVMGQLTEAVATLKMVIDKNPDNPAYQAQYRKAAAEWAAIFTALEN